MLDWIKRVKSRGLSEEPNAIRMATKSCNMKHIIGITWINFNQNSSTALERSVLIAYHSFMYTVNSYVHVRTKDYSAPRDLHRRAAY